tara:strand:- start:10978 stop:11616 length:639 start_codon:yes stop_codon:yes gene_type:complete
LHGLSVARFVAPLLSVIALHGVILVDKLYLAPGALATGFALIVITILFDMPTNRRMLIIATLILIGFMVFQMLAIYVDAALAMVVFLPPIIIHLWLAWMFGRTLFGGREPLIRRFSRLSRGTLPSELEVYTRRLTMLWALGMLCMAIIATVAPLLATPKAWSWIVNIYLPLASATLFLGEHAFRAVRFRHLGKNSPLKTLQTLMRPQTWLTP